MYECSSGQLWTRVEGSGVCFAEPFLLLLLCVCFDLCLCLLVMLLVSRQLLVPCMIFCKCLCQIDSGGPGAGMVTRRTRVCAALLTVHICSGLNYGQCRGGELLASLANSALLHDTTPPRQRRRWLLGGQLPSKKTHKEESTPSFVKFLFYLLFYFV